MWPDDDPTAAKLGLEEFTEDEKKEFIEQYGVGVDDRWVAAMFTKEVGGPVTALLNETARGEQLTAEQQEWLNSPLPPLNPNKAAGADSPSGRN